LQGGGACLEQEPIPISPTCLISMPCITPSLKWYFSVPEEPRSGVDVVVWWEVRRIPYNLIILLAGVVSLPLFLLFIQLAHGLRPGEDAVEPMALIVAPFAVNIAYTAGWIAELFLRLVWRDRSPAVAPAFLKLGLSFSLFVVFFPTAFWCVIWLFRSL
jgi:hypothetical protein